MHPTFQKYPRKIWRSRILAIFRFSKTWCPKSWFPGSTLVLCGGSTTSRSTFPSKDTPCIIPLDHPQFFANECSESGSSLQERFWRCWYYHLLKLFWLQRKMAWCQVLFDTIFIFDICVLAGWTRSLVTLELLSLRVLGTVTLPTLFC